MEEKSMTIKIIGLAIGLLVLGAGVYYLSQEKADSEARRIYLWIGAAGGAVAAVCALLLAL